jgi:adenylyl-sulfate kinase
VNPRYYLTRGKASFGAAVKIEAYGTQWHDAPGAADTFLAEANHRQHGREISGVIWLTGLSGAGKSTLCRLAENHLCQLGYRTFVIDGDTLRAGLNSNLGFSAADRKESVRRAAHAAAMLADAGILVLVALISPFTADRAEARTIIGSRYHEIFVNASLETCRQRDPKGLYHRALKGEIPEFTGISSPYEAPMAAELVLDASGLSASECTARLLDYVTKRFAPA